MEGIDSFAVLIFFGIVYFIPWIVAGSKGHKNTAAIAVTNLLFGWTFIGWAVALIWAVKE